MPLLVLKGTTDIFLKFFIVKKIFCMCNVTDSYVSFKVIVALTRKVINIVKD